MVLLKPPPTERGYKAIAQPLLYRYLHFLKLTSLKKCEKELVQHASQNDYPASATHSFTQLIWNKREEQVKRHTQTIL
ncbi:hypothetical protein CALCODRAFT_498993 [Calocera cornea HHB12733]|uniref:Uncharacterized protein n=1 Tax=Calocera cornea HHB12733 TaxID=1353952 RepID=A0A165EMP1_9BASI|nr:hypothetical protein CALCODRAFT_498993 [Calocera cornea HHB12733]